MLVALSFVMCCMGVAKVLLVCYSWLIICLSCVGCWLLVVLLFVGVCCCCFVCPLSFAMCCLLIVVCFYVINIIIRCVVFVACG